MSVFAAVILQVTAVLIAEPVARAGTVELKQGFESLGETFWTRTYEGFALYHRLTGDFAYRNVDIARVLAHLEQPKYQPLARELERRIDLTRKKMSERGLTLVDAVRETMPLAPEPVSGRIELLPLEPAQGFGCERAVFSGDSAILPTDEMREVDVYLSGEYHDFNLEVLARLSALGFKVRPFFAKSNMVLVGDAPSRMLAKLSGIDGVAHLAAVQVAYSAKRGYGLAELHYRRGVKAVTE